MTKEELIEKAKRDYPIGTIFKSVCEGSTQEFYTSEKDPKFFYENLCEEYELEHKYNIAVCDREGVVYFAGQWAEIISKPDQTEHKDKSKSVDIEKDPRYLELLKEELKGGLGQDGDGLWRANLSAQRRYYKEKLEAKDKELEEAKEIIKQFTNRF